MSDLPRRLVLDNPWLRVVSKRVAPHPGAPPEDYFVVEVTDWAMICPRTADGRFVLVEQYRPAVERSVLEFPAGRLDPGEAPADTIRRELVEETGHRVTRLMPLGSYFTDTGRLNNRAHAFYGDVEAVDDWMPEPGVVPVLLTALEIDRLIGEGRIVSLHHVGLWLLAKTTGLTGA